MRKKLVTLMLCLLAASLAVAEPISEQEAYQIAQQFMKGKSITTWAGTLQRSTLKSTRMASPQKNLYIFNAEQQGGFVIVSGDDRAPSILGYSDRGSLTTDDLPENVRWLLDYYDQSIASLGSNSVVRQTASASTRADIKPMLETEWGNGSPYNDLLPEIDGEKCPANESAMAQIIYYNRWPQGETAAITSYNLPPITFDWNNMSDNNIAKLMLYCTRASNVKYYKNTNDAGEEYITNMVYWGETDSPEYLALVNVFGYSEAKYAYRPNFADSEWDELLYSELAASRPVLYTGKSEKYAALFAIDGYSNEMYHVNWGYNGYWNGYFAFDLFQLEEDVYKGQSMVYNLCAPEGAGEIAKPQATVLNVAYDFTEAISDMDFDFTIYPTLNLERSAATDAFPSFSTRATIKSKDNATLQVGLALYDDNGLVEVLKEETYDFTADKAYTLSADITIGANIPQGTYRLVTVSRSGSADEWMTNLASTDRFITATISDTKIELDLQRYFSNGDTNVNGIDYYTFSAGGNNFAVMLATENNRALSGDVIIPGSVEYQGKAYKVCEVLIGSSNLTSLDVSQCEWLYKLVCYGDNELTKLTIGDCDITYLSCYSNPLLTSLDVSKCKSLKGLYCQDCALTSLDLSQCTNLEELNCGENALTSLDLSNCTKLESLSCHLNSLTALDLSQCNSLKELYCRNNTLSTLLVNTSVLKTLHCTSNVLTSLDLRKCENLETFEYSGNEPTLQELLLGKSKIKSLSFDTNSILTALDVSQCDSLETLRVRSGKFTTLTLGSNKKLETLYCQDNQLSKLDLSQCESLKELYCSGNNLTTLDASGLKNLETLECGTWMKEGNLTSLNVNGCINLKQLRCYNNKISTLKCDQCTNLEEVDCRTNEIASLDFSSCKKIEGLSCNNNPLVSLDISQCEELGGNFIFDKNLQELHLGKNKIRSLWFGYGNTGLTSLDVSQCDSLEELFIEKSNLTTLVLGEKKKLTSLHCGVNKLTSLDLSQCSALDLLWCNNNRLTKFSINDAAPLSKFIVVSNSFGFSQVTPRMYELLSNNDEYGSGKDGFVGWTPASDLCVGDMLDLSQELTAYDGSAVTISVEKMIGGAVVNGVDGKYTMPEAVGYRVIMKCESMPNIYFAGSFDVTEPSAIDQLPMDGMEININGGVVRVNGLTDDVKARLYDTSGRMVGSAQGSALSITAPNSGIYILRLSNAQGRSSAIKLMMK